ncbi:MAG TPA: flavodoxin family protein [Bacteroidales bacterium]
MKALVVYYSKNGTTRRFAEAIAYQVRKRVEDIQIKSIEEVTSHDILNSDLLYLGCWTSGRFLFGQKPGKPWIDFVANLPMVEGKKTVLFTTYRLTSGSMFRNMKKLLTPKGYHIIGSMKSRNGKFDYFSNGVLRYSLYQLIHTQIQGSNEYAPSEEGVLEIA